MLIGTMATSVVRLMFYILLIGHVYYELLITSGTFVILFDFIVYEAPFPLTMCNVAFDYFRCAQDDRHVKSEFQILI